MIVIPAVDIQNGKCVRLKQGRINARTIFSDNPVEMAVKWEEEGAEIIHVVDLDGAFKMAPKNTNVIKSILEKVRIPIQVGGGIRNESAIRMYLDMGVNRIIIGTEAITNPDLVFEASRMYPERIIVGIDARNGWAAIDGWTKTAPIKAVDLAKRFEKCRLAAINFTDIQRDGMETGVNIEATREFASAISTPVIASGGVSSIKDIRNLLPLREVGVIGVITGKALYSGRLDLKEAIHIARRPSL